MKFQRIGHKSRQGNQWHTGQTAQIHHTEKVRSYIADHQAKQYGQLLVIGLSQNIEYNAGYQGNGSHNQIRRIPKMRISKSTAKGICPNAEQGKSDGRNDGS